MTTNNELRSHSVTVQVPFHDLDPVGIVWHGNYAKYFEISRCALLETFNYNYDQMALSGFSWPVIDLHMRYVKSARFAEKLAVKSTLREWEYRLRIDYLVTDAVSGLRVCKGTSIQVAVDLKTHEMCLRSPEIIFERLGVA